jgi:toxin FitB
MMIATVAEGNDCVLVTGNEKDFAVVKIVNPMRTATGPTA